jgi:hypothetical protein
MLDLMSLDVINVLWTGQSGGGGFGTGGPDPAKISSLVEVFDNSNTSETDGSAWIPSPTFDTAPWSEAGDYNTPGGWFCDELARATGKRVRLLLVYKAGVSITYYDPSTGAGYARIASNWTLAGEPVFHIAGGQIGEEDSQNAMDQSTFHTGYTAFINGAKSDGMIHADAYVLVGGLASGYATYNGILQNLASANEGDHYGFVDASGLRTTDGTHFDGISLHKLGRKNLRTLSGLHGPFRKQGNPMALLGF